MSIKLIDPTPIEDEPLERILLGNCAKYVKKPSLYGKYGEIAEKMSQLNVPSDHICWGVTEKNYSEAKLVTTPWVNQESFGLLLLGMRGMGKSVMLRNILLDQIHARFGHYIIAVDPKQVDFSLIHKPIDNPKFIEMLSTIGMKPLRFNVGRIIPRFLVFPGEKPPSEAHPYMNSIKDFKTLNPTAQLKDLLYLLGLKQSSAPGEALQRVINMVNNPKMRPMQFRRSKVSTRLFYELVVHDIKNQDLSRREADEETGIKKRGASSTVLYYKLKDKIEQFVIGDPSIQNKLKVDPIQELVNNGILVLITNLDVDNERNLNIYVKILLNRVIADVIKFRQASPQTDLNEKIRYRGRVDKPVVVAIDEADTLVPKDLKTASPARNTILQLLTKYRYYGFSLFLVTQDPALIWDRPVRQCKYILTPKIMNEDQASLIHQRGVPEHAIEQLRKLYAGDEKPVQWALIEPDSNDDPKIFYPLAPCTKIPSETELASNLNKPEDEIVI